MPNIPMNYQTQQPIEPQVVYAGNQYIPQYYAPKYAYPQPPMQTQQYTQLNTQVQPIQQQTVANIPGKMVDSFDVVKATDIPMDGATYYFPKADRTEIYSKRWLQNGTTENLVYRLVTEEPKQGPIAVDWSEQIKALDGRIEKLEKASSVSKSKTTTQKEDAK